MTYATTTYPGPHRDCRLPGERRRNGNTRAELDALHKDYVGLVEHLYELNLHRLDAFKERCANMHEPINFDPENALSGMQDQCMEEIGLALKGAGE